MNCPIARAHRRFVDAEFRAVVIDRDRLCGADARAAGHRACRGAGGNVARERARACAICRLTRGGACIYIHVGRWCRLHNPPGASHDK